MATTQTGKRNEPIAPTEERLLRANEVAQRMSLSVRTVWSMRRSGDLPAFEYGGSVRFRLSDVLKVMDRHLVRRPSPEDPALPGRSVDSDTRHEVRL